MMRMLPPLLLCLTVACGGAEKDPQEPTANLQKAAETAEATKKVAAESVPATPEVKGPNYTHGKFVWFEHWSHNKKGQEKAQAFYSKLFGWDFVEQEMAGQKITVFTVGERPIGMVATSDKVSKKRKALWMGYISHPDVDGAVAATKEAGGTVHLPAMDMPGVGRFSVLGDNVGAMFGLIKASAGDPPHGEPPVGEFAWMELWTKESQAAQGAEFYTKAVGYKSAPFPMGETTYTMFAYDNEPYSGTATAPKAKYAGNWVPFVHVTDVDAAMKQAKKLKATPIVKAQDIEGVGRIGYFKDPTGAVIGLFAPAKPQEKK